MKFVSRTELRMESVMSNFQITQHAFMLDLT